MRFLTLSEVLYLHRRLLETTGGAEGIRDLRIVEAAIAAPKATFDGEDLYPGILPKAATLAYGLIQGHAFIDGNKRIGHAAMEVFLRLNGYELRASIDEQEKMVLAVSSSQFRRDELLTWLEHHAVPKPVISHK
jgi:death on curing protein